MYVLQCATLKYALSIEKRNLNSWHPPEKSFTGGFQLWIILHFEEDIQNAKGVPTI